MTGYVLAIDVGGTKAEAALVDEQGALLAGSRFRTPTGPDITPETFTTGLSEVITNAAGQLPSEAFVIGIGAASAGPVNLQTGEIFPVNMPGVMGFNLRETVQRIAAGLGHDVPVKMALDGQALALAESWLGVTQNAKASYAFVVSTGVGGGFVIDGHLMQGATGNAGHMGQSMRSSGLNTEQTACGPASVAWAQTQGWQGANGEDLARDARAGDTIARAAIERSAAAIGHALADLIHAVDLDMVAISGGFSFVADDYVDLVQQAQRERAQLYFAKTTQIVRSALGGDGPLIGAAALVLR